MGKSKKQIKQEQAQMQSDAIEMDSFSQGAVCMVLASRPYDESDYLREYDDFISTINKE